MADDPVLIAGQYAVEASSALPHLVAPLAAYRVADRRGARGDLMAIEVRPELPLRAVDLGLLCGASIPGLVMPVAHGVGTGPSGQGYFVVTGVPPGNSLWAELRPWPEQELIECVLRPVAMVLAALQQRGLTHRGVRPDNLFRTGPGEAATLGPAWAAPPASLQPPAYEPCDSAICLPAGRGDGSIADDVYALGVTLLTLALGRVPLDGLDAAAIMRRKVELGSYAALLGGDKLPAGLADLLRGMLAEDPEHRPSPALLLDAEAARGRRVAARPAVRAQRPLLVSGIQAWTARSLAYALAGNPERAAGLLRSGTVDHWLRRSLHDPGLALRLEETLRLRTLNAEEEMIGDSLLVMRAVAVLDPLAPLCWQGIALWPGGLGPALAGARGDPATESRLEMLVATEAIGHWAACRPDRCDAGELRQAARNHRARMSGKLGDAIARLTYTLNPLLPCASPLLTGCCVPRLPDLLPALEAVAANVDRKKLPIDRHILAFLAARSDSALQTEMKAATAEGEQPALVPLRVLATLQARLSAGALPGIAAWLRDAGILTVTGCRSRPRRAEIEAQITQYVAAGQLAPILALLHDPPGRAADATAAAGAHIRLQQLIRQIDGLEEEEAERALTAQRLGREIAIALGMSAGAIAVFALAVG